MGCVEDELIESATILSLLADSKLKPQTVAVELNRRLVKSERYDQALKAGDVRTARSELEIARDLDPKSSEIHLDLSDVYRQLGITPQRFFDR